MTGYIIYMFTVGISKFAFLRERGNYSVGHLVYQIAWLETILGCVVLVLTLSLSWLIIVRGTLKIGLLSWENLL